MENLLTEEDKKNLRLVSKYLRSFGMKEGILDIDLDSWQGYRENPEIPNGVTFSNNYTVEVPEIIIPIIEKIYKENYQKLIYVENETFNQVEFYIDTKDSTIEMKQNYSYTDEGSTDGSEWTLESGVETIGKIFESIEEVASGEEENILTLSYQGSGDSGYIEGTFDDTSITVPADVENWCYGELEDLHGGWEINEGSKGYFTFDRENMTINLEHTMYEDRNESLDLFSASFAKL